MYFFSFLSYDKINKNMKLHIIESNLFYMFIQKKKMEPEGQQFGRTEWYLIVHDIETNQFLFVYFYK